MLIYDIKAISKCYNTCPVVHAIKGISFCVEEGEFLAIVGPSGSGKTTLLNLLGTLDQPTSGSIYFRDINILELSRNKLADFRLDNIGFIFQAYNLISILSVKENIEFVLRMKGFRAAEVRRRVQEVIGALDLESYVNKRASDISYGEQQRVAIARAIVAEPSCILADEPTSSLDSKMGKVVVNLMRKINREKGITFIMATHDISVIEHCDTIIEIRDGKICSKSRRDSCLGAMRPKLNELDER